MKKAMMAIGLVVVAAALYAQVSVAGQTFYYKYVQTVNPQTEVRSLSREIDARSNVSTEIPEGLYITFTRNGCYPSDEKGLSKGYGGIDSGPYESVQGGAASASYTFKYYNNNSNYGIEITEFLIFSVDYKRMNFNASFKSSTHAALGMSPELYLQNVYVYEQSAPPQPQQETGSAGLDRMW